MKGRKEKGQDPEQMLLSVSTAASFQTMETSFSDDSNTFDRFREIQLTKQYEFSSAGANYALFTLFYSVLSSNNGFNAIQNMYIIQTNLSALMCFVLDKLCNISLRRSHVTQP